MNIQLPLFVLLTFATTVYAELPSIRFDRIYPLGLAAGGSVEVEINGGDIEGLTTLRFDQPGLSAEPIAGKERWFKITAAGDVPAGTYDVRLVGRFGVSGSKLIAVQRGLTELLEVEPNNDADKPQQVQINSVINGNSDGENVDRFRFTARAGQRIVLDIDAQKLDSQLDSQLVLLNSVGKQLASSGDYSGRDSLIDFVAPADGDYIALVHDLSYRGGQPYRLAISDRPHVENVFPRAVQRGQSVELTVLGRNLGGAAATPGVDPQLESVKMTITAPSDATGYKFFEHPTDHSVLPTAASSRLDGFQIRPTLPTGESLTAVPMLLVDQPVTLEAESNNDKEKPQAISLPAVVAGRFDSRGDADWYSFTTTEDGPLVVDVYSERLNAQADPYVVFVDEQGNRMQEFDDDGIRNAAFDGHLRDPAGSVNLQKNKTYRLLVQDRYGRGGPRFQYAISLRKPAKGLFVSAIHRENPQPAGLNVFAGGAAGLDIILPQRDGQSTPVIVTAENLPPGMHFAPTSIPNESRATFVVWTDEGAAPWTGAIKLFANYERNGQQVKEEVRAYNRVWNDAKGSTRPTRDLAAAVIEKAPFLVSPENDRALVKAGEKLELKFNIKRQWPEFTGDMKLIPLTFPGNFQMSEVQLPAGANDGTLSINVQNNTQPGEYTLSILAQAQVPFNKDAAAKEKPNTLVSMPSKPVTIVVRPAS